MRNLPAPARRVAALLVVSVALSGCSLFNQSSRSTTAAIAAGALNPDSADAPRRLKPTVRWKKCGKPFQCAKVRVPLDHGAPRGDKISLALIRLPAPAKAERIGSLLVNPGGPGASGVDFVRHAAVDTVPAELRARFDIVGFDPRGVGRSRPVSCGGAQEAFLEHDMAAVTSAEVAGILSSAQQLAQACEVDSGSLLQHVSTDAVARDLDVIRRAVGDHKLSYLGYSYGTTIGLRYAERFPKRIRAMVLDGPVDPAIGWLQRAEEQEAVLEVTLREFFRECRQDSDCGRGGPRLRLRDFDRLIDQLETSPLPAEQVAPGRRLRASEALFATALLLKYRGPGWQLLAGALQMAMAGDGSWLAAVAESGTGKAAGRAGQEWLAPLLAVNCVDIPAPEPDEYPSAAARLSRRSPHFGGLMLLLASPCAYWPVDAERRPAPVTAPGTPALLVVGTTGDPTTPYRWAKRVAAHLQSGRLVTRTGSGHTAFGGINVCLDRTVSRYMADLVVPADGAGCS